MKVWTHAYELTYTDKRLKPRRGALLKVEWALGQHGFSDLHPWPEFGEPDLDVHIQSLAELKFTELVESSLEANYVDRDYRLMKRNAFDAMILPRSHKLVTNILTLTVETLRDLHKKGFSHIKVKMGTDFEAETEAFLNLVKSTQIQWRLDFGGLLSEQQLNEWWGKLDIPTAKQIDFIEDPVAEGEIKTNGPWANDWYQQPRASVRIIKVAREGIEDFAQYDRLVFSHSLDHPLGQAYALWAAARFYQQHPKKVEVCGLAAPDIYELDDFSKAWHCEGPRMKATVGTGFGFDKILESLKWQKVL